MGNIIILKEACTNLHLPPVHPQQIDLCALPPASHRLVRLGHPERCRVGTSFRELRWRPCSRPARFSEPGSTAARALPEFSGQSAQSVLCCCSPKAVATWEWGDNNDTHIPVCRPVPLNWSLCPKSGPVPVIGAKETSKMKENAV